MTFWSSLRWLSALGFVLMVLLIWFGAEHRNANQHSGDQHMRHAPPIVRESP